MQNLMLTVLFNLNVRMENDKVLLHCSHTKKKLCCTYDTSNLLRPLEVI